MSHWRLVSPRLVRAIKEAGGELYVWTVDDGPRIGRLEKLGVTGVITNDPRLFAQLRRARRWRRNSPPGRPRRWTCGRLVATSDCLGQRVAAPPAELDDAAQHRLLAWSCAKVKLQPYSTAVPLATPTLTQPESASSTSFQSSPLRYWTRKRIDSRAPFGVPGIDARMPIRSGCLTVSQTLTVAHGRGVPRARGRREHQECEDGDKHDATHEDERI